MEQAPIYFTIWNDSWKDSREQQGNNGLQAAGTDRIRCDMPTEGGPDEDPRERSDTVWPSTDRDKPSDQEQAPRVFHPDEWPIRTHVRPCNSIYSALEVDEETGTEWLPMETREGVAYTAIDDNGQDQTHRRRLGELDNLMRPADDDSGSAEVNRPRWHSRPPNIGRHEYDANGQYILPTTSFDTVFEIYEDDENHLTVEEWWASEGVTSAVGTPRWKLPLKLKHYKTMFEFLITRPTFQRSENFEAKFKMEAAIKLINIVFHGIWEKKYYQDALEYSAAARMDVERILKGPWKTVVWCVDYHMRQLRKDDLDESEWWNEETRRRMRRPRKVPERIFACVDETRLDSGRGGWLRQATRRGGAGKGFEYSMPGTELLDEKAWQRKQNSLVSRSIVAVQRLKAQLSYV